MEKRKLIMVLSHKIVVDFAYFFSLFLCLTIGMMVVHMLTDRFGLGRFGIGHVGLFRPFN